MMTEFALGFPVRHSLAVCPSGNCSSSWSAGCTLDEPLQPTMDMGAKRPSRLLTDSDTVPSGCTPWHGPPGGWVDHESWMRRSALNHRNCERTLQTE